MLYSNIIPMIDECICQYSNTVGNCYLKVSLLLKVLCVCVSLYPVDY